MKQTSYNISNIIKAASKSVAERSMSDAAAACLRKGEKAAGVGVSVDGTWQQKRFSSTLGVVTAISKVYCALEFMML